MLSGVSLADKHLAENLHRTARELAEELNRSYYGVAGRLKKMRTSVKAED